MVLYMVYIYLFVLLSPCFRRTTFGGIISKSPLRIQTFVSRAIVIVSSFKELRRLPQMCRDLEKTRSTETLVAGMARKSRAIRAMIGNSVACFWIENIRKMVETSSRYLPSTTGADLTKCLVPMARYRPYLFLLLVRLALPRN